MNSKRQFSRRVNHPVDLGSRDMTVIAQSRFGIRKLIRKMQSSGFYNKARKLALIDKDMETLTQLV